MKKIVDGLAYNTDTATALGIKKFDFEHHDRSRTHGESVLYQTPGGAFFVVTDLTQDVWNGRKKAREPRPHNEFRPISADDANKWLMEGEVEVTHNPFGDVPEAAAEAEVGATLYVRMPSSLKKRIEDAARASGHSANVWAMRCMESCLGVDCQELRILISHK